MCNAAHNSSMWTYLYFLFLCHMSTSGFEVICKVTSCLKGNFLVILSEGASVCRKGCGLSLTVDRSIVGHGKENGYDKYKCDCRKGFGLIPKEDKSGLGYSKEDGCGLSHTVDGSGVGCGKVDGWILR
jgi:hypothetical protein